MPKVSIGVIGAGYWGPNLVRTFLEIPDVTVTAVADRDSGRLDHVRSRHPQIERFVHDHRALFDMALDAVIVATPPETHYAIAKECLLHGLDVLVEKPLTTRVDQAVELEELAAARDRILMVGHIGAYNPAVTALKEMVDAGELGELRYLDAVRAGLGLFHPTLNVVWDLAPHDVAILLHVLGETPQSVSAKGIACVQGSVEDVAYLTMMFPSGVMAHSRVSWLDPFKSRRITVVGSKKMVVYDDLEVHEKLKVYDKSVNAIRQTDTFGEYQFSYHYGSVVSPYIHFEEPLRAECLHLVECVQERKRPLTDGANGVEVVRVIEAAQRSLRNSGASVPIASAGRAAAAPNVVWIPDRDPEAAAVLEL
jgi:predicted dehydrogenase